MFALSNMMAVSDIACEIALNDDSLLCLLCDLIQTIYKTYYGAPLLNLLINTFYAICNLITEGFKNSEVVEKLLKDETSMRDMIKNMIETLKIE